MCDHTPSHTCMHAHTHAGSYSHQGQHEGPDTAEPWKEEILVEYVGLLPYVKPALRRVLGSEDGLCKCV